MYLKVSSFFIQNFSFFNICSIKKYSLISILLQTSVQLKVLLFMGECFDSARADGIMLVPLALASFLASR